MKHFSIVSFRFYCLFLNGIAEEALENLGRLIKNEAVIEIEDDDGDGDNDKDENDGANGKQTQTENAIGEANRTQSDPISANSSILVIPMVRCDSDVTKTTQKPKRGAKKAKEASQNKRKSPRI